MQEHKETNRCPATRHQRNELVLKIAPSVFPVKVGFFFKAMSYSTVPRSWTSPSKPALLECTQTRALYTIAAPLSPAFSSGSKNNYIHAFTLHFIASSGIWQYVCAHSLTNYMSFCCSPLLTCPPSSHALWQNNCRIGVCALPCPASSIHTNTEQAVQVSPFN